MKKIKIPLQINKALLAKSKSVAKVIYLSLIPLGFLFIFYHLVFASKVIPGVRVGNIKVGGKDAATVKTLLKNELETEKIEVSYTFEDKTYTITSSDIGLVYDVNETVDRLFFLGRTGNVIVDSKDKLAALLKGIRVVPVYRYSDDIVNAKILGIEGEVDILSSDPRFVLEKDGSLVITLASKGRKLDDEQVRKQLFSSINTLTSTSNLLLVKEVSPKNSTQDLESVREQVKNIFKNPPIVSFEDKRWEFSNADLLSYLDYEKSQGNLKLTTNKPALSKLADQLALEVDAEPRGEVFTLDGQRVTEFRPKSDGRRLDKGTFKNDFTRALLASHEGAEVKLVANPLKAVGGTNEYGIYALLGEGVSFYHGSIPGRIKNLNLAAQRISGVLVAPGEIFSFNKSVGEISFKTGYDAAYIIDKGRTVLGEGGGVCQASTTLFRAVLNAGLPIVKRTAHAYRVHYYEEKSDIGFDATVFAPSVDFQFKNDTEGYILVQSEADYALQMLKFSIYGTPDGRKVEITKPVVTNVSPPPEPAYEEDPTLRKGQVVQVDWEAWGATATFSRKVTKDGEVLYEDTFASRYQPWRAVYKKGTKD